MEQVLKSHEKISKQYADAYIDTLGIDGSRQPQFIHSLTKLRRMEKIRDDSLKRVFALRKNLQLNN